MFANALSEWVFRYFLKSIAFDFKKNYGKRVCPIGNIDVDKLSLGSKEEVYNEVKQKLKELSRGGGYIMSSSNSLTLYCKDENVLAMVKAFEEFR